MFDHNWLTMAHTCPTSSNGGRNLPIWPTLADIGKQMAQIGHVPVSWFEALAKNKMKRSRYLFKSPGFWKCARISFVVRGCVFP